MCFIFSAISLWQAFSEVRLTCTQKRGCVFMCGQGWTQIATCRRVLVQISEVYPLSGCLVAVCGATSPFVCLRTLMFRRELAWFLQPSAQKIITLCDYRRGMDWILELLTTTRNLQVITAPPLTSTLYSSLQHPLSLFKSAVSSRAVPWQRLLTVEILQLPTLRSFLSS
jgi:hypothetical protein